MNNSKAEKSILFHILPYVVLGAVFCVLIILNIFYYDHFLDSDMSAELIFSKLLAEEGRLIASNDWYYSTEFRILYTQLIMVPLFYITDNFHIVRAVTNIVTYILMLVSYFYMMKPFKVNRRLVAYTGAVLLIPFSETLVTHMQLGNTYMPHIILLFFAMGMYMRLSAYTGEIRALRRTVLLLFYITLSVILGMSGVRYLLALYAPLVTASVIHVAKGDEFALFRESFGVSETGMPYLKRLIRAEEVKYLFYAAVGTAAAVSGYIINSLVLGRIYVFQTYGSTDFINIYDPSGTELVKRLQNTLGSLLMLLGYVPDKSVMSLRGIVSIGAFILTVLILVFAYRSARTTSGRRLYMSIFFFSALFVNLFFFIFTDSTLVPRYFITILSFALPLFCFYEENEDFKFDRALVALLLSVFIILGFAKTVYSFVTTDKNEKLKEAIAAIEGEGLDFGYATYWNANILTELSNGRVETANIRNVQDMQYFIWSTPYKYYEDDYHEGRVFLLLNDEEELSLNESVKLKNVGETRNIGDYYLHIFEDKEELFGAYEKGGEKFR
ncbi:MAG: hypothetical protein IJ608_04340 [Lachnospiraceae bacterium]|nr:hypothetical protein [Lachnospiraceae bacterium]